MMPGNPRQKNNHVKNGLLRWLLFGTGWFSILCAIIGVFLPLVPSIPFLLLAAVCFSKSSERFHSWLVEHKHMGPMIRSYMAGGGIPLRAKLMAIGTIWISFPVSVFLFVEVFWMKVLLLSIAAAVTYYLLAQPSAAPARKEDNVNLNL